MRRVESIRLNRLAVTFVIPAALGLLWGAAGTAAAADAPGDQTLFGSPEEAV